MSYNSGVIVLVISNLNYSPNYSLNCTPLSPITITNQLFPSSGISVITTIMIFSASVIIKVIIPLSKKKKTIINYRPSNLGNYFFLKRTTGGD